MTTKHQSRNELFSRSVDPLCAEAIESATKAMDKFPQPNYVAAKIAEETGEVIRAYIHMVEGRDTTPDDLRKECVQLIGLVLRLYWEGDDTIRHNKPEIFGA